MFPVQIALLDVHNDPDLLTSAMDLAPEEALNEDAATVFGAFTPENILVGVLILVPEAGFMRINWMRVVPELRHNGIGTAMIGALTSEFQSFEDAQKLISWIPVYEDGEPVREFLESTGLFDITEEDLDGTGIYIALWNGRTFEDLMEEENEG